MTGPEISEAGNERGSFRDPFGQVFRHHGKIYRSVFQPGVADFEAAKSAGIHNDLVELGLFIPYTEIEASDFSPKGTVYLLNHPALPVVTYPWEWCFSMLKDAALLHLEVMERLVPKGFWLRDASAFNAQFDGKKLCLIDTLSIGQRIPDSPWVAYGQFCSHFRAPLVMAAYRDVRMLSLWRSYIDGFPLDLASKVLPLKRRLQPGLLMHLVLHARYQESADRKDDIGKSKATRQVRVTDRGLIGLIRSLRRTIEGITWNRSSRIWENYGEIRNYQSEDIKRKAEYVTRVIDRLSPKMVWDLGANTGEYSIIAASRGAFVLSIDGDPACSDFLYQKLSQERSLGRILPLTMDLANPSPGLGWNSEERPSLASRGPADLILALALIHHLVFSSCIPLPRIAEWLSQLGQNLLVEFIPPTDPMVKKLVMNRRGEHLPYDLDRFRSSFSKYFSFLEEAPLENGRILFFLHIKLS